MRKKRIHTKEFFERFIARIPRGIPARPLNEQSIPQARWQDCEAIYRSERLTYDPDHPGDKVLIGALGDRLLGISDDRHLLTVAGTRAGKSVGLISNLLFYPGSILATDLKAELAEITAARREALGQRVFVVDPFEIASGSIARYRARFNPLAALHPGLKTVIEDAGIIADALVVAGQSKDPHWDESARNFIDGLILHVISDPAFDGQRTLITVRELLMAALTIDEQAETAENEEPVCALEVQMLANAERLAGSPETAAIAAAIEGAALDFYDKSDRERDSVLSTARRHTKLLDYAAMRSVLSGHDFDLSELKTDPRGISVYLCLPASRIGMSSRWLRIFVNQLLDCMERTKVRPAVPALVCLDEFAVLGYMKQLEDAIGQIASFGVKLWVFLQDLSQIRTLYKERWESFIANAGIMQFFGNSDLVTAEYVARKLGKTTVAVSRAGEASPELRRAGLSGRSTDIQLHDLLTPEEITRQFARDNADKQQLVLWAGHHPMILQRVEYFDQASPVHRHFRGKYAATTW